MQVSRSDAIGLCIGLGFKTAKSFDKARLTKKVNELATSEAYASLEVSEDIVEDEEERERLNGILAEMRECGEEVEVVKELPAKEVEADEADEVEEETDDEEEAEEADDEDEAEDEADEADDEADEADDEEEEEPAPKKSKGKATKAEKPAKEKKEKKAPKETGPSAYGSAIDFMCANPDCEFSALQADLVEKGLFKPSAAHTAYSCVRKIVKTLRTNGLMGAPAAAKKSAKKK